MGRYLIALSLVLMPAVCQGQPPAQPEPQTPSTKHADESDYFELLFAPLNIGGGVDLASSRQATIYAGAKLGFGCCIEGKHPHERGVTMTLDLGYDRLQSRNGFSTELAVLFPVVRFPKPRAEQSNYLRLYVTPGAGYRAGAGDFGGYASAKLTLAFLSDGRIFKGDGSPYVEIQRRFPFASPVHGDVRVIIGLVSVLCKHCGWD